MIDETGGISQMQKIQTKKQVSMETVAPLQEVVASTPLESINALRGQIQYGLELMATTRSRIEQAYDELTSSK